jgi:hypothetical protein
MHCFNHPTYEAAGVCRNCGRALCHNCIAICDDAVACKGKCEARVEAIQRMIATNQITTQSLPAQIWQGGIQALAVGVLFALMGGIFFAFVNDDFGRYLGASFIVLGAIVAIRGATAIHNSRKYPRAASSNPATSTTPSMERFK